MKRVKTNFLIWFKRRLFAGLLALVPLLVTFWLAGFIFVKMTNWALKLVLYFIPALPIWAQQGVRVATLLLIVIILLLVGEFMRHKLGRMMAKFAEWILLKLPILGSIYTTTRQIGEALWTPRGNMFRQVVLIEYPRKGIYTIAFVTNDNPKGCEIAAKAGEDDLLSVFVPTTPNPTSGFLLFMPRGDCKFLDMKVSDGLKLVISGGAGSGKQ